MDLQPLRQRDELLLQRVAEFLVFEVPEQRARIQARCKIPASTVDAMTVLTLSDLGDGRSLLRWESDVQLSGLLGSLSGPLIKSTADALLRDVFACINAKLGGQSPSTASV